MTNPQIYLCITDPVISLSACLMKVFALVPIWRRVWNADGLDVMRQELIQDNCSLEAHSKWRLRSHPSSQVPPSADWIINIIWVTPFFGGITMEWQLAISMPAVCGQLGRQLLHRQDTRVWDTKNWQLDGLKWRAIYSPAASVLLSAQSHEIYLRDTIYSF